MEAPACALLDAAAAAVPGWVVRSVARVLSGQGRVLTADIALAARVAGVDAQRAVTEELAPLLARDVDEQRTNPLTVLRRAARFPTAVLREAGADAVRRDDFQAWAFPDDIYDLAPATWRDVDESLHEPGISWGAWKAKIVLDRRRRGGQR